MTEFRESVCNVLVAANESNNAMMREVERTTSKELINEMGLFCRGYRAALTVVALAFGITLQDITGD